MAIEPISSAMTFNAQPVAQQMTAPKPVERSAEEFTEGSMQNAAAPVDNVTLSVNAAQAKDGESGSQQGNQQEQQPSATAEAVKKAVEEMNKKMSNSVAQFGIHEETNHLTIKIVDKETRKVIKELPPEKTLDMIAKVWEMAGLLVDEKR
ncbi:MAG: flagellar protein FlaG [Lachnospiraceae bacterium]|nr:flagellar protein FlaG [Lachnospiraceae bacterium]